MTSLNPTEQDMLSRGRTVFEACYRGVVPTPASADPKAFSGATMKMFNDFWGGIDQLTMREKRLVVLGVLAGLGKPELFAIHGESALRNGEMDADELRGVVLMALPYVGFPKASGCQVETEKVIARVGATPAPLGSKDHP